MASRAPHIVARDAALVRLSRAFPQEYEVIYNEERAARGLPPVRRRKTAEERIADLQREIEALRASAEVRPIVDALPPPPPLEPVERCASR